MKKNNWSPCSELKLLIKREKKIHSEISQEDNLKDKWAHESHYLLRETISNTQKQIAFEV